LCFQAEDGIRDWSVTGVQTCALPILSWRSFSLSGEPIMNAPPGSETISGQLVQPLAAPVVVSGARGAELDGAGVGAVDAACVSRSEERRVGKRGEHGGRRTIKDKNE